MDYDRSTAARLNVQGFITWCRGLGLADPDVFDVDDLVMYKNQRAVIFGLFDVARRIRTSVPKFVSYERAKFQPRVRSNVDEKDPVDQAVSKILEECVCSPRVCLSRTRRDCIAFQETHTYVLRILIG